MLWRRCRQGGIQAWCRAGRKPLHHAHADSALERARQVGGSFGATCGLLLMKLLPTWHIQPGIYAMCAATAMLGGVFRASISLVVIVVEGTQARAAAGDAAGFAC